MSKENYLQVGDMCIDTKRGTTGTIVEFIDSNYRPCYIIEDYSSDDIYIQSANNIIEYDTDYFKII